MTGAVLTGEDSEFESALCRAKGENGVLRTLPNALGQTATHLAITSPRRLKRLLAAGADPDCVDREGLTPLMYAAAYGEQHSVLHLVEHQATWVLKSPQYSHNFLDYAIRNSNVHVVEGFISLLRGRGDHSTASKELDHCIHTYLITRPGDQDDTRIARRLFELGADADAIVNRRTLMHLTKTQVMSQLIMKSGFTSFHIRDDFGRTPLMQVAHLFDAKTLTKVALHDQNADFTAQDASGRNALHHLLASDNISRFEQRRELVSCLNVLLRHGASASTADDCVCACSEKGCTALTFALHLLRRYVDSAIIIDLLQAARHHSDCDDVCKWFSAIRRYHAFEEKGLKHTCCLARHQYTTVPSCRLGLDTFAGTRAKQIQAMANFNTKSSGNVCTDDDIISSLATLCFMYEQRPVAKNESAVAQRRRNVCHLSLTVAE